MSSDDHMPVFMQVAELSAKLAPFEQLAEPTMGGEDFSFIAEKARRDSSLLSPCLMKCLLRTLW